MESVSELNERITVAIEQLKSRLPQPDDQAAKLQTGDQNLKLKEKKHSWNLSLMN